MSLRGLPSFLALLTSAPVFGQAISFLAPVDASVSGYARGTSMCPSCFAVGDLNGDGKPDIVYSVSGRIPPAIVALGNGDGTFRHGYEFASPSAPGRPFIGDFNGDGKLDVAFSSSSTAIFFGDGAGNFGAPSPITGCAALSVVADLNGDGRLDLACGTGILLGNGDGTFRTAPSLISPAVLAADFNGDGKIDLLLADILGGLDIALGKGDGTFVTTPITGEPLLQTVLAGDFNGDGRVDIAGAFFDGLQIFVLPGRGDGSFGPAIATETLPGPLTASADFNHDGKLDLVAGDAILAGNGNGTFRPPVFVGVVTQACGGVPGSAITPPCDYTLSGLAVADFNGDNLPDLAAGYVAQGIQSASVAVVSILLNDGPGDGFATAGVSSLNPGFPVTPDAYVSAYGTNLAPATEIAATNPLPDTLGGVRVHVRDRSHATEVLAPLLYVSPSQINYILPSSDPYAWVGIERVGTPYVAKGIAVPIGLPAPVLDPVLFALPQGLAAASAVRIAPDQTQTPVSVAGCLSNCHLFPIDVSGDPVYLTLYGTGFARARIATCYVGIQGITASYVGSQNSSGLDQVNLLLPKSLAGAGQVPVVCNIGDASTNSVSIAIQ